LSNGIEGPAHWSLRLFGGFELGTLLGGEKVPLPGKRERVLLAYLALSPNCRQSRRKLAALLWGDATDETLLDNLRASLWKLRKALDDTENRVLASDGEDIVLDAQAFEVDTWAFQRLAANADRVGLEAAAKLYAGKFLDGLDIDSEEFEAWRRTEATRYRDQATDVLTRLMAQLAEAGETERAIEAGVATIMTAHVLVPSLDEKRPATLSRRVVYDLLRDELGYEGVILSDDLEMKAIAAEYAVPSAAVLAIQAGCDGALVCSGDHDIQAAALEALVHAVEDERVPLLRVEDALKRQRRAKERFLAQPVLARPLDGRSLRAALGRDEHRAIAEEMARFL
jgi:hypothetical protein